MYTWIQLRMCVYISAGRIVPSFLGVFRGWQATDCSSPTDEDARQIAAGIMEACQGVIATHGNGGALPAAPPALAVTRPAGCVTGALASSPEAGGVYSALCMKLLLQPAAMLRRTEHNRVGVATQATTRPPKSSCATCSSSL